MQLAVASKSFLKSTFQVIAPPSWQPSRNFLVKAAHSKLIQKNVHGANANVPMKT